MENDLLHKIQNIVRETQNDVTAYLQSDAPIENYPKDIDWKLKQMHVYIIIAFLEDIVNKKGKK
jgi:molecular chaperone GrpE (heat shock protein)